jgi:hypothetical protein
MLQQCCCCGGKVDSDDSFHEEVVDEKFSLFAHVLCWDTQQTVERKMSQMRSSTPHRQRWNVLHTQVR